MESTDYKLTAATPERFFVGNRRRRGVALRHAGMPWSDWQPWSKPVRGGLVRQPRGAAQAEPAPSPMPHDPWRRPMACGRQLPLGLEVQQDLRLGFDRLAVEQRGPVDPLLDRVGGGLQQQRMP